MDEKRALDILVANACCVSTKVGCDKCPFNETQDCENVVFDDVLEQAVETINMTKRRK